MFSGLLFADGLVPETRAQGVQPMAVIRTGSGQPLVTATQTLFVPDSPFSQTLQIAVGFSTDEIFAPETFFDSVTLTLADDLESLAAIYFTLDCTGAYWAPTPGGVFVHPDSIVREMIGFPDVAPDHELKMAFLLTLPVPTSMTGRELTLYLDLFDNQDAVGSLAWMSVVTVVPEPSAISLLGLGAAMVLWRRRKS